MKVVLEYIQSLLVNQPEKMVSRCFLIFVTTVSHADAELQYGCASLIIMCLYVVSISFRTSTSRVLQSLALFQSFLRKYPAVF